MAAEWYYFRDGRESGPVSASKLVELARAGKVTPNTPIRRGANGEWRPATSIQGLFGAAVPSAPMPPPIMPEPRASEKRDLHAPATSRRVSTRMVITASASCIVALVSIIVVASRMGSSRNDTRDLASAQKPPTVSSRRISADQGEWWKKDSLAESESGKKDPVSGSVPASTVPPPAQTLPSGPPATLSAETIFLQASPAVVLVRVSGKDTKPLAQGSGFFVSSAGLVVTNLHVIEGAISGEVVMADGKSTPVIGIAGVDENADLALLQVQTDSAPVLKVADSLQQPGAMVYAIGSPKGFQNTISDGLISGIRHEPNGTTLIQTTAPISPGSSGGPLVAADGSVVGVVTATWRGAQNLNLAVAAVHIKSLIERQSPVRPLAELSGTAKRVPTVGLNSDDKQALSAVWEALDKKDLGAALRLLRQIPAAKQGKAYWKATGMLNDQLGKTEDAYNAYLKAIDEDADSDVLLKLVPIAMRLCGGALSFKAPEYYKTAISACESAIRLNPENAEAFNYLGVVQEYGQFAGHAGQRDRSTGSLNTAVALDPGNLGAWYNLAMLRLERDDGVGAIAALEEASKRLGDLKNFRLVPFYSSESIKEFTNSESVEVVIRLRLASAYRWSGRYAESTEQLRRVLEVEPMNAVACWCMCFTYRGWRKDFKHPDAVQWERRAEQLDPMFISRVAESGLAVGFGPRLFHK